MLGVTLHPIQGKYKYFQSHATETGISAGLVGGWHIHMHADLTSTSELLFASLERVLVLNVSHENNLIFM